MTTSKKKKILSYATIVFSLIVLIFSALQLFNVWDKAIYVAEPLLGVILALQAVQYWHKNKGIAIILLCAAAFMFIVAGVVIFLK